MSFCSTATILQQFEPGIKAVSLPCKRWSCRDCRPKNQFRVVKKAKRGSPNTLVTLTVNPKWGNDRDHRARSLRDAWQRVSRKAKRFQNGKKLPYFVVFEETKQGEPHLHILCRSNWIDQKWLGDQMQVEMNAPVVDIRRVKNQKAVSGYVSKYLGKNPEKFPGCKRYWSSHDWICIEEKPWQNPDGTPITQWVELMSLEATIRKYTMRFYKHTVFNLRNGPEHWFEEDWEGKFKRGGLVPEGAPDLFDRPPQGHRSGAGEYVE